VVIGVAAATFLLLHAIPGDPARQVLGLHASAAAIAALRHRWGSTARSPASSGATSVTS